MLYTPNFCFLTGGNVLVIQLLLRERNLSGVPEKLEGNSFVSPKKELNQGNLVLKKDCHQVFPFVTEKVKQVGFSL